MHILWTITPANIAHIRNICYNSARKEVRHIRDELGLKKGDSLYLRDVAAFYDLSPEELAVMLYYPLKKSA